ncbi:ADP-ribosyl cyclase/cyclic ADP-ribose hydrolase 1-like isoform 2-T3 [Fundulus diaphanus]
MESGLERKRGRRKLIIAVILAVLVVVVIAIILAVILSRRDDDFKREFMGRCQKFKGANCRTIWDAFQQAYVNQDPCEVPPEAYDPVIAAAPMESACNTLMFWSKTKDVVHHFTGKKDCFRTVEDSLLGSVLDGLVWCGKKGSNETFTTGCPGWTECEKNPVRSFWNRTSAAFGDSACGDVTVMLNGSLPAPFDERSIFGSIEVKRFTSPKVKALNVVLVTQENFVTNCTNASLQKLKMGLDEGISYGCSEVPDSQLEACASDPEKPCGACW